MDNSQKIRTLVVPACVVLLLGFVAYNWQTGSFSETKEQQEPNPQAVKSVTTKPAFEITTDFVMPQRKARKSSQQSNYTVTKKTETSSSHSSSTTTHHVGVVRNDDKQTVREFDTQPTGSLEDSSQAGFASSDVLSGANSEPDFNVEENFAGSSEVDFASKLATDRGTLELPESLVADTTLAAPERSSEDVWTVGESVDVQPTRHESIGSHIRRQEFETSVQRFDSLGSVQPEDEFETAKLETRKSDPAKVKQRNATTDERSPGFRFENTTDLTVAFAFHGKIERLAPGEIFEREATGTQLQSVQFDRGGDFGSAHVDVNSATDYVFKVSRLGWQLIPRTGS